MIGFVSSRHPQDYGWSLVDRIRDPSAADGKLSKPESGSVCVSSTTVDKSPVATLRSLPSGHAVGACENSKA